MTFIRRWSVPLLAYALFCCAQSSPTCAEEIKSEFKRGPDLTAEEIISRMLKEYESCQSYQDEGNVETQFPNSTDIHLFSTAFVRPNRFRFESAEQLPPDRPSRRVVVWRDGDLIRSWWAANKELREFHELDIALAGPSAVSGGSAIRISRLLMSPQFLPQWGKFYFKNAKLLGEEKANGVPCYKLEITRPANAGNETIWIDQEQFLIRKVLEEVRADGVKATTITTYHPQVNIDLDPAMFTFVPPVVESHVAATTLPAPPPSPWYLRLARKLFGP